MPTFINGKIFVGTDPTSFVSAMKIEAGQVTWTGESSEVNDPDAINLEGKTVLPGLIDVHTHPKYIADALHGVACTPPNVNSIEEMKAALKQSPAFGKGPATWIEGWGFDETKLAEHRTPTVDDLDASRRPNQYLSIARIVTRQLATQELWHSQGLPQALQIRLVALLVTSRMATPTVT